jgi:alpha-galactosidase
LAVFQNADGWVLETRHCAYAFGTTADGLLVHRYWGLRLTEASDYPGAVEPIAADSFDLPENRRREEYPGQEGAKYSEPCICVEFEDGIRDLRLRYMGVELNIGINHIVIHLKDQKYPLHVNLHYQAHEESDLIERWAELRNGGESPIKVRRLFSGLWHIPELDDYFLTYVTGRWSDEMHIQHEQLCGGKKVLESRRLTTGHGGNPWFAVDDGKSSETSGRVWFGTLAWSGNWKTVGEITTTGSLQMLTGVNDWDFCWMLTAGETISTPHAFAGMSENGFGEASRKMHDFIRECVLPHGHSERKVIFNSWEATTFAVDIQSQIQLANIAAGLGVELFVLDDGWFKGRYDDRVGLGDWSPDQGKFPDGLNPLISAVKSLGMSFGLWLEPEMVNPDSDLYRHHPDWAIQFPGRALTSARNQYILNLGRKDVQDHLIQVIDSLLSSYEISFVKWDMNRNVSEPGWQGAAGDPRELWMRYVFGLYRVLEEVRARHPKVVFQSCSGGGGRADLGVLHYADQVWVSDNTDACARLRIQEGYAQIFPAATMESWVTDQNDSLLPLDFRFHVCMTGVLGIGGDISTWDALKLADAKKWVLVYKSQRDLIMWGDRYLLRSARNHAYSAIEYLNKDKTRGIIFVFQTFQTPPWKTPTLHLQGLTLDRKYVIEGVVKSGRAWQESGLQIPLDNFQSKIVLIQRN